MNETQSGCVRHGRVDCDDCFMEACGGSEFAHPSRLARFRSAITGRFVRGSTAQRHPRETVTESNHEFDLPRGGYFLHDDMVEFAYALVRYDVVEPFPDRELIRKRLGQWERGTWPR